MAPVISFFTRAGIWIIGTLAGLKAAELTGVVGDANSEGTTPRVFRWLSSGFVIALAVLLGVLIHKLYTYVKNR